MDSNREREVINQKLHFELWDLSKKYTTILMNHLKDSYNNEHLQELSNSIYKQFIAEVKSRNFVIKKDNKVIQCWKTMINTVNKEKLYKPSIRLLHQTSVQRSYQHL